MRKGSTRRGKQSLFQISAKEKRMKDEAKGPTRGTARPASPLKFIKSFRNANKSKIVHAEQCISVMLFYK